MNDYNTISRDYLLSRATSNQPYQTMPVQQQQQQINPAQAYRTYSNIAKLAKGGSSAGGTGTATGSFGGGFNMAGGAVSGAAPVASTGSTAGLATGSGGGAFNMAGGASGLGSSGGAAGGGSSAAGGMAAAAPWLGMAALIAAKAYDTKKHGGIGYKDQIKDPSLAPKSDFDRWGLDKYAYLGSGDLYKGSFDLATGKVKPWAKSLSAPLKGLKDLL